MFDIFDYAEYFHPQRGDRNTTHLPLLGYPLTVWIISILYLFFVLEMGPKYMKNRPAFQLKRALSIYNFAQIVFNLIIGYSALQLQWRYGVYDMGCCRTLPSDHEHKSLEVWTSYAYFIMKFIDLTDTIFFVLRKSEKQITFLHVYHHVMMVNVCYIFLHFYGAGGELYSILVINSFIHSIMYGYYLITAIFPNSRSMISNWKKYITLLQLTQFVVIMIHNGYTLVSRPDCNFSRYNVFNVIQSAYMIVLFLKFYAKAYRTKTKTTENHLHSN